ncbi:G patch domain and ankyrin repeat-containing protein 1 [Gryganskiella cystojenkinii]|nr:G patch domain and ankyrin repeat-containing protein 1 [Gryganskiella cystojenkinii]
MPPTRPNFYGSKKSTRDDDAGMIYRDIAFVPSGSLVMKHQTSTSDMSPSNVANRQAEATSVSEFYRSVLSTPTKVTPPKIQKHSKTARRIGTRAGTGTARGARAATTSSILVPFTAVTTSSLSSKESSLSASTKDTAASAAIINETIRRNWQVNPAVFSSSQSDKSNPGSPEEQESQSTTTSDSATYDGEASERPVTPGYVLCEACQIEVREEDWDRHQSGTAHLMSKDSPIQPLDRLKLGHENKGFRMLINSGWEYDKGLGAQGQGTRHPVATRLKHDRLALGATGASKKVVTHTFEEIEASRSKPSVKSNTRVPLNADDYRRKATKENKDRVKLLAYMKSS